MKQLTAVAILLCFLLAAGTEGKPVTTGRKYFKLVGREKCNSEEMLSAPRCGGGYALSLRSGRSSSTLWRIKTADPKVEPFFYLEDSLVGKPIVMQSVNRQDPLGNCEAYATASSACRTSQVGLGLPTNAGTTSIWILERASGGPNRYYIRAVSDDCPGKRVVYLGALKTCDSTNPAGSGSLSLYSKTDPRAATVWEVESLPNPPLPACKKGLRHDPITGCYYSKNATGTYCYTVTYKKDAVQEGLDDDWSAIIGNYWANATVGNYHAYKNGSALYCESPRETTVRYRCDPTATQAFMSDSAEVDQCVYSITIDTACACKKPVVYPANSG